MPENMNQVQGSVALPPTEGGNAVQGDCAPPRPFDAVLVQRHERLALIADAARAIVRSIRRVFPVMGRRWLHDAWEDRHIVVAEVANHLDQLERLINPGCLPFGDERRADPFNAAGGWIAESLAVAFKTLARCHNRILQHYAVEEQISAASATADAVPSTDALGTVIRYRSFVWWTGYSLLAIKPAFLDDLELTANGLTELLEEPDVRLAVLLAEINKAAEVAPVNKTSQPQKPRWDTTGHIYRLFWGEIVIKKVQPKAVNVIKILDAFHAARWRKRINVPSGLENGETLHQTLRSLKKNLTVITFHAAEKGKGITWEVVSPPQ